ncbi:lipase family protein [Cellvibrio japonicus]|uniref:Lipase family protein n=1 Tax=Cellvibrio japonicus (strain Ueda107) TaxID=498211 RepID=B3PDF0_CELJU|nr:lipase family protein [Cellvibrio japonicus]ACE85646.1 lipase family protein [Cellvibrio japonicus Ueda107]
MNLPINMTRDTSGHVYLDPDIAVLLGAASRAAYDDYANRNNPAYTPAAIPFPIGTFNFVQRFTGFDDVAWGLGDEERYGVIFQWSEQADVYVFAFRGTSSVYDMLLDLESAAPAVFVPYKNPGNFPDDVHVADGFNKVYATKNDTMTASMQAQLFEIIQTLPTPPGQILITGHSLGAALATLFTMDVAVSRPDIAVANINFASPRVGQSKWQSTYDQTYGLLNRTICVRNSFDLVPKVPPQNWPFDFQDVGQVFPVAFNVTGIHVDLPALVLAWHALSNYMYVVSRATVNNPQVWTGTFPDSEHDSWQMESVDPSTSATELELAKSRQDVKRILAQLV